MGRKVQIAEYEGEMQRKLEAAMEHLNRVWANTRNAMGLKLDTSDPMPEWARTYSPDDPRYPLAAAEQYIYETLQGMYKQWGSTDGQLCPYEDCAYDLAIKDSGWWSCGHCLRDFYADSTDSDFEDYHCYRDGEREYTPIKPDKMPLARILGKSWATPNK